MQEWKDLKREALDMTVHHTLGGDSSLCTGCAACAAICPTEAIIMEPDGEGFLQPNVRCALCTDCGLCKEVCPVNSLRERALSDAIEQPPDQFPTVWAAWNTDEEIRRQSSSGGVFTVLAENILDKGGVVVGAAFDEQLAVRHCLVERKEELHKLRGSKYVQSEIPPELYRNVRSLLKQGRYVLFSGTPCQVAALRNYISQPYENMYCCDIVCMGTPSLLLFHTFIAWKNMNSEGEINSCGFRDKTFGWKHPRMRLEYKNGSSEYIQQSAYYSAFLKRIALRLSCYNCFFKGVKRGGDITLADFWGVAGKYPQYDQKDQGTSLVLANNPKGQDLLEKCRDRLFLGRADIETAIAGNPMLVRSAFCPPQRDRFYLDLNTLPFNTLVRNYQLYKPLLHQRVFRSLKRRVKNALHKLRVLEQNQG